MVLCFHHDEFFFTSQVLYLMVDFFSLLKTFIWHVLNISFGMFLVCYLALSNPLFDVFEVFNLLASFGKCLEGTLVLITGEKRLISYL